MIFVLWRWLACSVVAIVCASLHGFSAPEPKENTSGPLEILQACQARYLASDDFLLSGTARTYSGPPLEFSAKGTWMLAVEHPNKLSYVRTRQAGDVGKILYDGTLYLKDDDRSYSVKGTGASLKELYSFLPGADEPLLNFAESAVPVFTLRSDLLTTENPCLSTIQSGPIEEINGRPCYAISLGPCVSEPRSTYYVTTDTLDLLRYVVTTYKAEVEDSDINVDNAAVSDSYYVTTYDVEMQRRGDGAAADQMLTSDVFKPEKTYQGYELLRQYETFDEIPDSDDSDGDYEDKEDSKSKASSSQDSFALAISLPAETTIPLKSLATFDHDIQAITVRSFNSESSIFVALQNDTVHEVDASGLQLNSFKLRADDINFPIGGQSPIMYVSLYDQESDKYSLSSYDTSKTKPEPVVLTADASHYMLMADEQTSDTWAVYVDENFETLFHVNGTDGEPIKRRAQVADYIIPRYSKGKLAGYIYYAQGWTTGVEIDLGFKWVRNRTLPYYTVDIESKPGMAEGEYLVQLANDKVGILTNQDTFDEFRSRAWGYGVDEWLPEFARSGKGTAAVPGFVYHIASYAGITVFDRAGRVALQSKLVSANGDNDIPDPDLMMFCDLDLDGTLEVLMVLGRRVYHLDYSKHIGFKD